MENEIIIAAIKKVNTIGRDTGNWYCFAEYIAEQAGVSTETMRAALAKAEREGLVRGTNVRCESKGRKNTRQTITKKTYRIVK